MDLLFLVSRVLHVAVGVFWAGAIIFVAGFLQPSVRDAGPDGAKVMAGLMRRGLLNVMPAVAIVTVLTGLHLFWTVSGGFSPAYVTSTRGLTYGLGGLAAILGMGFGIGVLRPSTIKAGALTRQAAEAGADRERLLGEAAALRNRAAAAGRMVAWLLAVATLTMALGRYV